MEPRKNGEDCFRQEANRESQVKKKSVAEWLRELASEIESGLMGEKIGFDEIVQEAEDFFRDEM